MSLLKSEDENFLETKSGRKILEGLKRKVDIFIGIKNIFNFFLLKKIIEFLLSESKTLKLLVV